MPPRKSKSTSIPTIIATPPMIMPPRPKTPLISMFKVLIHYAQSINDSSTPFKIRQYTDTITHLETYPSSELCDVADVQKWLSLNGQKNPTKMIQKIQEYIETGEIQDATHALACPIVQAMTELTQVYGIGPAKAKELFQTYGIFTVSQLETQITSQPKLLHEKQTIGLRYHWELQQRIPRSEMDAYAKVLQDNANDISPDIELSINGSYRRGLASSGDIDVLITDRTGKGQHSTFRQQLKQRLIQKNIIVEVLADGNKKFMGITRLTPSSIARHLDLMDTDRQSYPFAVLYFTGSGGFNILMRQKALQQGYTMNEFGMSDKLTKAPVDASAIEAKIHKSCFETEKDIFQFLEMEYVPPSERSTVTVSKVIS